VKVKTFNPYTYEPMTAILAKARMASYFNPKAKELPWKISNPGIN
jgi:isoleucyl-tRNA synthetase